MLILSDRQLSEVQASDNDVLMNAFVEKMDMFTRCRKECDEIWQKTPVSALSYLS